jgi:outer membrane lipoprotein SlyB
MKLNLTMAPLALLASLVPACATTATETYPAPQGNWVMYGQVESIRATDHYAQGDPGGGAIAGAVIGGVLGTALGGRGLGTFIGATEGAIIGAQTSQGGYAGRTFEVFVRFEDGSARRFVFENQVPFRRGEYVVWTPQGLAHHGY